MCKKYNSPILIATFFNLRVFTWPWFLPSRSALAIPSLLWEHRYIVFLLCLYIYGCVFIHSQLNNHALRSTIFILFWDVDCFARLKAEQFFATQWPGFVMVRARHCVMLYRIQVVSFRIRVKLHIHFNV